MKYSPYSEHQMVPFFHYPLLVFMKNVFSTRFDTPDVQVYKNALLQVYKYARTWFWKISIMQVSMYGMWLYNFVCMPIYMVKIHEDAYWPDNLSLFSASYEHYRESKKQNYGENWLLWFICMSGECCKIIFVLQGVQKNCQNCHFWSPF